MTDFGLTPEAQKLITDIFKRHPQVERVEVFGSRAMGNYEDSSDIDLVLWGDVDTRLQGEIMLELDELPLPYTFDVKIYHTINHQPLKEHIDKYAKLLYKRSDI
jgi:uncharacterized protein